MCAWSASCAGSTYQSRSTLVKVLRHWHAPGQTSATGAGLTSGLRLCLLLLPSASRTCVADAQATDARLSSYG